MVATVWQTGSKKPHWNFDGCGFSDGNKFEKDERNRRQIRFGEAMGEPARSRMRRATAIEPLFNIIYIMRNQYRGGASHDKLGTARTY
jgi:hypothetical protein